MVEFSFGRRYFRILGAVFRQYAGEDGSGPVHPSARYVFGKAVALVLALMPVRPLARRRRISTGVRHHTRCGELRGVAYGAGGPGRYDLVKNTAFE